MKEATVNPYMIFAKKVRQTKTWETYGRYLSVPRQGQAIGALYRAATTSASKRPRGTPSPAQIQQATASASKRPRGTTDDEHAMKRAQTNPSSPEKELQHAIDTNAKISDELLKPAFQKGKYLGEGVEGAARLSGNWVIKSFFESTNRDREEEIHLEIWKKLSSECKKYICQPIPVDSKRFTLQRVAQEDGWESETLSGSPSETPREIKLEIKNAEACLKKAGFEHNDLYTEIYDSHTRGFKKKYNNVVVLWRETSQEEIPEYSVKLIDFGHASKIPIHEKKVST